jgi:zinc protease
MNSMYSSLAASPAGPIQMSAPRILSGGDLRFGTATPGEFSQRTIKELKEWVDPQLKHGPIELGIAGDTTWEDASAAVASTLGALPQRDERDTALDLQQLRLRGRPGMPLYLFTTAPSLRLVALSRFCPVLDLGDMHMDRRCRFLAALLTERMRVRLRIELGASYGFDAAFVSYTGFPELSYFSVSTTVSSELAERANQLLADEIESLHRGNISQDAFERVKHPSVSKRAEDLRDNSYWSYTVLRDSQEFPERLDEARDRQADCASITRAEIADLTDRYFKPERWFQFTAYPQVSTTFQKPTLQAFK